MWYSLTEDSSSEILSFKNVEALAQAALITQAGSECVGLCEEN